MKMRILGRFFAGASIIAAPLGCSPSADRLVAADQAEIVITKAPAPAAAFLRNSGGALHNAIMDRVFAKLNGRRSTDQRAICRALLDVVSGAPEIKTASLRREVIQLLFGPPGRGMTDPRNAYHMSRVSLFDACGASYSRELSAAPGMLMSSTLEVPCELNCTGGEGEDSSESTFTVSTQALNRGNQIAAASRDALSLDSLDVQLTALTTAGIGGFNVVEMDMIQTHASLARSSYISAHESAQASHSSCTENQKRAKGNAIADYDATAFLGAVGFVAGASLIPKVAALVAWQEVFTGAVVAAGVVSAYKTIVEVSTPCH